MNYAWINFRCWLFEMHLLFYQYFLLLVSPIRNLIFILALFFSFIKVLLPSSSFFVDNMLELPSVPFQTWGTFFILSLRSSLQSEGIEKSLLNNGINGFKGLRCPYLKSTDTISDLCLIFSQPWTLTNCRFLPPLPIV